MIRPFYKVCLCLKRQIWSCWLKYLHMFSWNYWRLIQQPDTSNVKLNGKLTNVVLQNIRGTKSIQVHLTKGHKDKFDLMLFLIFVSYFHLLKSLKKVCVRSKCIRDGFSWLWISLRVIIKSSDFSKFMISIWHLFQQVYEIKYEELYCAFWKVRS